MVNKSRFGLSKRRRTHLSQLFHVSLNISHFYNYIWVLTLIGICVDRLDPALCRSTISGISRWWSYLIILGHSKFVALIVSFYGARYIRWIRGVRGAWSDVWLTDIDLKVSSPLRVFRSFIRFAILLVLLLLSLQILVFWYAFKFCPLLLLLN